MPFRFFHERFPKLGERETRSVTVMPGSDTGLPSDEYGFLEMYCDEPGCDCRRVFLFVMGKQQGGPLAVIAWGWEELSLYRDWLGGDDDEAARQMQGPELNMGSPETEHSPKLLELATDMLLSDPAHVERIKRHYHMFREDVEGQRRPRRGPPKQRKRRRR